MISIPQGSTGAIVSYLDKRDYDLCYLDKVILNLLGQPQSGWIDLKSTNMTKLEFLYKLTKSKAALKKITLIPGETYYYFLQEVASKLNVSTLKLFNAYAIYAYRKDGNILADTYHIPLGMKEKDIILYLLNSTNKRYESLSKKIFRTYNKKKWYDRYITIASIVQKESASKNEMRIISSVIYNRLKKSMKLQMDGILNYGKYSHTKITPKMIKNDTSDYNTYKYKGLPSNPVCAVELASIKAAISPNITDYLYFVKAPDGKSHNFSSSFKKHKKHIRQLKKYKHSKKVKAKTKKFKRSKPKVVKKNYYKRSRVILKDLYH